MDISKLSGTGIAKIVPGINNIAITTTVRKGDKIMRFMIEVRQVFEASGFPQDVRNAATLRWMNGKVSVTGGAGHNLAERRDS